MKKFLDQPIVTISKESYLTLIVIVMPVLNFLSGINIDIYAPSMPSIATYFNVSILVMKNTITATILGWAFGAIVFGALIDAIGRKKTLFYGMFLYMLASGFALYCQNIDQLMLIRFLQGFTVVSVTVGCRALILDNFTGHHYNIAIIYTFIGFGMGHVFGPFIGGVLQYYFGWKANFAALFILTLFLTLMLIFFVKESIPERQSLNLKDIGGRYLTVLRHKKIIAGVIILGLTQIQMLLYPTIGPFIVEGFLHYNALVYGNTALIVGGGYLAGNLINRGLLKYISLKKSCYAAYIILLLAVALSYLFTLFSSLNLVTLLVPMILINISSGLIFSNVMASNLKQFPSSAGITMAIQISLLAVVTTIGIFIANDISITSLLSLSIIYSILAGLTLLIFFGSYRKLVMD